MGYFDDDDFKYSANHSADADYDESFDDENFPKENFDEDGKKKRDALILLTIGLVAMLYGAFSVIDEEYREPVGYTSAQLPGENIAPRRVEIKGGRLANITKDLRDPFALEEPFAPTAPTATVAPPVKADGQPQKSVPVALTLQGIAASGDVRLAIISDGNISAVVGVGDTFGDKRVANVGDDTVELVAPNGEQVILRLAQ